MKKLILLLLLITPLLLIGQKNKAKEVEYGFNRLPSAPLEGDFKTYSVVINDSKFNLSKYGYTKATVKEMIKFKNLSPVDKNGDLEIFLNIDAQTFSKKLNEKTITKKDKSTYKEYYYVVSCLIPAQYTLSDGERTQMEQVSISAGSNYKTSSFRSKEKLKNNWNSDGGISKNIRKNTSTVINNLINDLSLKHDERIVKRKSKFYTIKRAKKKGLMRFENAFQKTLKMGKASIKTADIESMKTAMKDVLPVWEKGLKEFDPKDKKTRQVYEASGYNLARFYIMTNDFDKARSTIKKLKANPKSKSEVEELNNELKYVEDLISINQDVRVFYKGKYVPGSISEAEMLAKGNNYIVKKNGEKLYGNMNFPKKGPASQVMIIVDGKSQQVKTSEIDYLENEDKTWMPLPIRKSKSWAIGMGEVLERNESIILYQQELGGRLELIKMYYLKNGKKTPIDLTTVDMLFHVNEKLSALFKESPTLEKDIKSGKYDTNEERDLIKIAQDYHKLMTAK